MKNNLKTLWLCLLLSVSATTFSQPAFDIKPSVPVVLRHGDHFEFTVEIVNHSDSEITGQVQLLLADALNNESVDGWFQNVFPNQFFTVAAKDTESYKFPMEIPFQFTSAMHWQIVAQSATFKQEKTGIIPILTNQFFRKETTRFSLKPLSTEINVKSLADSDKIPNLLHRGLSLEITSSRLWEACKQIALMMEVQNKPLDYFEKWAALSYAKFINDSFPAISNLVAATSADPKQHNLIAEVSPWAVSSGKPVQAYLPVFDRMSQANAISNSFAFFLFAQNDDGSFPWYMGGVGDEEATRYISRTLQKMLTGGFVSSEQSASIRSIKAAADKWLKQSRHATALPVAFVNRQHDSLITILKTAPKKITPLPPVRWKAGNLQLNLNDTLRSGYAFQTITGTMVNPVLSKTVVNTRDTARSLMGIITHDYFTDMPAGKSNQHLKLTKKIFLKTGQKLPRLADEHTVFHAGDKLRIVITAEAAHPIYYLLLMDANPSSFFQKGSGMFVQRKNLDFYERQLAAGRKYFFPVLPAGKHEFAYETTVTQAGNFAAGMTTAESLATPGIFNFIKGYPVTIE